MLKGELKIMYKWKYEMPEGFSDMLMNSGYNKENYRKI